MGGLLHLVQRGRDLAGHSPPRPLLAVPNVTAHPIWHPSTASVPTVMVYHNLVRMLVRCNTIQYSIYHIYKQQTTTLFNKSLSYQLPADGDVSDLTSPAPVWILLSVVNLEPPSANRDLVPPSPVWLSDLVPPSLGEEGFWICWKSSKSCPIWSSRNSLNCCSLSFSPSASWVVYLPSCCANVVA